MVSEQAIRDALHTVTDPEIGKPIDDLGMVGGVAVEGGAVRVDILLTVSGCPLKDEIRSRVTEALNRIDGVEEIDIRLGEMSAEERQKLASGLKGEMQFTKPDNRTAVIAVSSGKGGVGKSTVTTNLAAAMQSLGHKVGVLDADIWGFSIPRMFGLRDQRPVAFDGMILPLVADGPEGQAPGSPGVKVISIGFFLENEEKPVIWRGPMLHKALEQFLTDVYWGEDLEYLFIDLPPGTGDISLSMATFLPAAGMIVVTTPQPVAQKVAERAANMATQVKQKLLGVIENMSGVVCGHCGESTPIFGSGGGRELAERLEVPLLGEVPLVAEIREYSDAGTPFVWVEPDHPAAEAYRTLAENVERFRPRRRLPIAGG